eukprot:gene24365-30699_t
MRQFNVDTWIFTSQLVSTDQCSVSSVTTAILSSSLKSTYSTSHIEKDCSLELVDCPLVALRMCGDSCPGSILRKDLLTHIASVAIQPAEILLLAQSVRLLSAYNKTLSAENIALHEKQRTDLRQLAEMEVCVDGAGEALVNGFYSFCGIKNFGGVFERHGVNAARYVIHKRLLLCGDYRWFLSLIPQGVTPSEVGTIRDVNLYWAPCEASDDLPNDD